MEKGVFPDTLKIAKVNPVFQAGEVDDLSNYLCFPVPPEYLKEQCITVSMTIC